MGQMPCGIYQHNSMILKTCTFPLVSQYHPHDHHQGHLYYNPINISICPAVSITFPLSSWIEHLSMENCDSEYCLIPKDFILTPIHRIFRSMFLSFISWYFMYVIATIFPQSYFDRLNHFICVWSVSFILQSFFLILFSYRHPCGARVMFWSLISCNYSAD